MELMATCAFGLEKLVQEEMKKIGLWVEKTEDGRVSFVGDESGLVWANLWSRCADRIQIKMGEFTAQTFDQLFDAIQALDWGKYIGVNDAFPVVATSVKSLLRSEPAIQSIVKKAVVKKLRQKHAIEVFPENSGAVYQIVVKFNKDRCVISIDSSGESLHKRGYRTQASVAPLKETLAAALVKLSDWTPERTLVDPFCGSGTIAIEAARMAQKIAPGLHRPFAFQKWRWMDQKKIAEAYAEANSAVKPAEKLPMYCFDIDAAVLALAEENAARARCEGIHFKRSDFMDLDFSKFENCTFIANPPYGERLDDAAHVKAMYREFGKKFAQTKNCSLFLLTSHENFPALFGRTADKNRKLFNGNIRCYLFSFLPR